MSVVVVATIEPLPEHRDAILAAFEAAIPEVHAEPGCELYALHEFDGKVVMIEKWASKEALAVHGTGAALVVLGEALKGKLAGAPVINVMHARPVGDPTLGAL